MSRSLAVTLGCIILSCMCLCTGFNSHPINNSGPLVPGTSNTFSFIFPSIGTRLPIDTSVYIRWTSQLSSTRDVSLALCEDTTVVQVITINTHNTGEYHWPLKQMATGILYRIKIALFSSPDTFDYSAAFSLSSDYSGTIAITAPQSDSSWLRGSNHTIRWTSSGKVGSFVSIFFGNASSGYTVIKTQETNDGSYTWSIPATLASGKGYRIKIASYYDTEVFGLSDSFTVFSVYSGTITVTSPTAATVCSTGTNCTVTWTTTDTIGTNVRFDLYRDSLFIQYLGIAATNVRSYNWIPADTLLSANNYRLKVSSYYDAGIFDFSDTFMLKGKK